MRTLSILHRVVVVGAALSIVACSPAHRVATQAALPMKGRMVVQPTPMGAVTPPQIDPTQFPDGASEAFDHQPGLWFDNAFRGWGVDGGCNRLTDVALEECAFQAVLTDDGGRTWLPGGDIQTFAYAPTRAYQGQFGFTAADSHTGWVYGPVTLVTHDGGRTWIADSLPSPIQQMSSTPSGVWAISAACNGFCPIFHLVGSAWSSVTETWAVIGAAELSGVTSDAAYILGRELVVTRDGGASWSTVRAGCGLPGSIYEKFAVQGSRRIWVWCGDQPSTSEQGGDLVSSSDGGASWRLVAASHLGEPGSPPKLGNLPTTGSQLDLVALPSGSLWLTRGKLGLVARSTDGGTNWTRLLGDDGAGGYRLIFAADYSAAWAASTGCLYRTTDIGAHWTLMQRRAGYECGTPRLR